MAPGEMYAVQAPALAVDAARCLVLWNLTVRIVGEEFREDDVIREGTTDGESIAHDGPLRLAEQTENLAEIVNQSGQDEPARPAIAADGFRCLHQVLNLAQFRIGIAVIDERVKELHRLPYPHAAAAQRQIFAFLGQHEIERLIAMIEAIELLDAGPRFCSIVAKFFFRFRWGRITRL